MLMLIIREAIPGRFFMFGLLLAAFSSTAVLAQKQLPPPPNVNPPEVRLAVTTLKAKGFEPAEIILPASRLLLIINDQSGMGQATIQIVRSKGKQQIPVTPVRRKQGPIELIDLSEGNYIFSEISHPGWICKVTVAAK